MSIILDWLDPSRRHREEELNRLEWSRDQEGLGDPHKGPIDLDSGVVAIKAPGAGDEAGPVLAAPDAAPDSASDAAPDAAPDSTPDAEAPITRPAKP